MLIKGDYSNMSQLGRQVPLSETEIELVVNGESYEVRVQSNWTLQYVLHTELGLTGTKEFCNEGACGACTVILDGRAVLSCLILAIECNGKNVELSLIHI